MEVRRLISGQGDQLRDVRLRALADAPYAFSSSVARESALAPTFWEGRAAESELGQDGVVFVASEDARILGMAGGFIDGTTRDVAVVWGMWVDPDARCQGIGRELLEAVADWGEIAGARRLRLAVTNSDESEPAAVMYRGLGFVETGEQEPLDWNPSLTARIMVRTA